MAYQSLYMSFFLSFSFFFFFLSKQISSESITTSDGYRRGYVSFAHSLLYLSWNTLRIFMLEYMYLQYPFFTWITFRILYSLWITFRILYLLGYFQIPLFTWITFEICHLLELPSESYIQMDNL